MENKLPRSEQNIQKLLNAGFSEAYRADKQLKDDTLKLLSRKVIERKKAVEPETQITIAFAVIWIAIIALFSFELRISFYLTDLVKIASGLSVITIPVLSFVLIILKKRTHEKEPA